MLPMCRQTTWKNCFDCDLVMVKCRLQVESMSYDCKISEVAVIIREMPQDSGLRLTIRSKNKLKYQ